MWSVVGAVSGFLGGIWLIAYLFHILPIYPDKTLWSDIPIVFTLVPLPVLAAFSLGFFGYLIDEG